MVTVHAHPFAVVTGASSGFGFELAKCCAANQFDLLITADEPQIHGAVARLRTFGTRVEGVEADLATREGIDRLYAATKGHAVTALLVSSGGRLDRAFLDHEFDEVHKIIDTNVTGSLYLIQKIGRDMRNRGDGRILISGPVSGTYKAINYGIEALVHSFATALRTELRNWGVTVTCLMPGAKEPGVLSASKCSTPRSATAAEPAPDEMATLGFAAMMHGQADVCSPFLNFTHALDTNRSRPLVADRLAIDDLSRATNGRAKPDGREP